MPEQALTPAFVIHTRPYRETSLLVQLFTLEFGKVSAVARGARAKRSKSRGILQPGVPLLVELAGKGSLLNFKQVEASNLALPLFGNYLYSALYLNELLYYLLDENTAYPGLYQLYQDSLMALAKQQPLEACLREFELNLIADLGFALTEPEQLADGVNYQYRLDQGFVVTSLRLSNVIFSYQEVLMLLSFDPLQASHLACAKRFCRIAIAQLLGGRELTSRKLFTPIKTTNKAVR
ncbi:MULTISPECIES: DNA repair protein RecO [unclassified Agarivorans]|uniref:DNA repair protein RecO n=1 Tax=unclassified Agarivorans TaxID=2636026 RepID=UPI0010E662FF|nr:MULTISPECIES: DNA repair protein RecO [unclassified Agarivorans]MDO6763144.1 DNA repair protein RecO [Agarivorans sp. 1_MG-2023]GDY24431.1 DNA repair protein RecO [Agarivorans sp. Toyoura001]